MASLKSTLLKYQDQFCKILLFDLTESELLHLNLSKDNEKLLQFDKLNTLTLSNYIAQTLELAQSKIAIGGYLEDRPIYGKSDHFGQEQEARTIHLGVDIWCQVNTPISAPISAKVHSFKNNDNFGDYGPTIILEHTLDEHTFYTLYGHLSKSSITGLKVGQMISAGEVFAHIGNTSENGDWPPHLHFQVITEIGNYKGDFPGVCNVLEVDTYKTICPDPKLIIKL